MKGDQSSSAAYAFALLETSTFQGQPNCSHQYILTHQAPGLGVKCFELCLYVHVSIHKAVKENVCFVFNFIRAKWS